MSTSPDDLFDLAPCGLLVLSPVGEIRRVNKTFCKWMKYDSASLIGRTFQNLLSTGGRIFYQTHLAPLLRIQGSIAEVKLELKRRDGDKIPVILNAVEEKGVQEPVIHLAILIATDRHKYERELLYQRQRAEDLASRNARSQDELALAQSRLKLGMEAASLYSWDFDPRTGLRQYDDAASSLLDTKAVGPLPSHLFLAAIHHEDRSREQEALSQALTGDGLYRCTYRIQGHDGALRVVSSAGRTFFDSEGRPIHLVGVLQDITSTSKQQSEAQDRALFAEQMVGIVSHDLRNPLSVISMNAQLLTLLLKDERQLASAATIIRSVERSQRLINDLLDFTQVRLGQRMTIKSIRTNLHAEVADAVRELSQAFPGNIIRHLPDGNPWCLVDNDRIVQAIGNLVANAVTHGSPQQPITIRTENRGNFFYISVHNSGTPIPPDLLSQLFEPMIRGETYGSSGNGVGLGLYIVREIAKAHAGSVRVSSDESSGTIFTIILPCI